VGSQCLRGRFRTEGSRGNTEARATLVDKVRADHVDQQSHRLRGDIALRVDHEEGSFPYSASKQLVELSASCGEVGLGVWYFLWGSYYGGWAVFVFFVQEGEPSPFKGEGRVLVLDLESSKLVYSER